MEQVMKRRPPLLPASLAVAGLVVLAIPAQGRDGVREDRTVRAQDSADRAAQQSDRDRTRSAEDAAKAAERATRDEAKATLDTTRKQIDSEERAAKDAADAAEQAAKDAEDAAKEAAKAAEDAAKDAADAAEDAAKEAEDAAEDAAEHGSSEEMRDLALDEKPEYDDRGFPVRRGEIVALDMRADGLVKAQAAGFGVIERTRLPSLDAEMVRLKAPDSMDANSALKAMRGYDPDGSYDLTHFYGLQYRPQGGASGKSVPLSRRSGKLTIGMIDTAVAAHKSLKGADVEIRDFSSGKAAVPTEHGTAIASLLASEGASRIVAANIFQGGTGSPYTSADAIVRALDWLVGQKVRVINISLAGPRNRILDTLVGKTIAKGSVIVAAAGNGGPSAPPAYPAALPKVVAVTAVDKNLRVYRYANQGRYVTVAALGVDVAAAKPGGGTVAHSGTSFATPHIAAWYARCVGKESSTACNAKLETSARDLGEPGRDPVYGYGYVR